MQYLRVRNKESVNNIVKSDWRMQYLYLVNHHIIRFSGWFNESKGGKVVVKGFSKCWVERIVKAEQARLRLIMTRCGVPHDVRPELFTIIIYVKENEEVCSSATPKHVDDQTFKGAGVGIGATSMCLMHQPRNNDISLLQNRTRDLDGKDDTGFRWRIYVSKL